MKQYQYTVYCPRCKKTSTIVEKSIKDKLFSVRCPHCGYVFTRIESYKKYFPSEHRI
ncbi:MAG: zinc-ribbon domain-containing protein [Thermoplasmatota archaeon]